MGAALAWTCGTRAAEGALAVAAPLVLMLAEAVLVEIVTARGWQWHAPTAAAAASAAVEKTSEDHPRRTSVPPGRMRRITKC